VVVTSTANGLLKKGNTNISAFTGAPAAPPAYSVIAPSESLVYFPTNNLSGNDIEILKIRAYDGGEYSNAEGTLLVNLTQVNQRPQINAVFNSTSGVRNEVLEIPFATLAAGLGTTDLEDFIGTDSATKFDKLTFRIEQVLGGQSLKIGSSPSGAQTTAAAAAAAALFDANNNTVIKNKSVFWMPPANSAGTFDAFTVSVVDSGNLSSPIVAKVIVTVSGADKSPTIQNLNALIGNVGAGTGATENRAFEISYDTLKSATVLDVRDEDSSWVSLVVTATNNGIFKKGSNALAIFTGMPSAPPNTAVIGPNESITYLPTANLNGSQMILKVRAFDGATYSANEATVNVNIVPVNTAPTMSTLNDFIISAQSQSAPIAFNYNQLRSKTDVSDIEEPVGTNEIGFKIKSIVGGQIYRTSVSPKALLTIGSVLGPNETFEWNAPWVLSGRLQAFTVAAVDALGAESALTLPVFFNTQFVNSKPTFISENMLSGAVEDTPFIISHTMLAQALPGSDVESGVLDYQITGLGEGNYWRKGVTQFSAVDLPIVVKPGESITWMPPTDRNFDNKPGGAGSTIAFKVKLFDGNNDASVNEKDVNVNIVSVNDLPTFGTISSVSPTTKNKSGGQVITWQNIKDVISVNDLDTLGDNIQYRVENVSSGTLRVGTTNQGVNVSLMVQQPFFVKSGANGVTTSTDYNWTPPLNGLGDFVVMTVRAYDGKDFSVSTAEVKITVTGSNDKPELLLTDVVLGKAGTGTLGTSQNLPIVNSYYTH
jgi:hypothetical protein